MDINKLLQKAENIIDKEREEKIIINDIVKECNVNELTAMVMVFIYRNKTNKTQDGVIYY